MHLCDVQAENISSLEGMRFYAAKRSTSACKAVFARLCLFAELPRANKAIHDSTVHRVRLFHVRGRIISPLSSPRLSFCPSLYTARFQCLLCSPPLSVPYLPHWPIDLIRSQSEYGNCHISNINASRAEFAPLGNRGLELAGGIIDNCKPFQIQIRRI